MKTFLLILILFVYANASAQHDTSFSLIKTIKGDIVSFTIDNLDNIYIVNSRNQVKKLNANGDSVAVYNDVKKFGQATLIDVSNPLKLLLYYRDYATVVVLDRFLNAVNTIDLRKNNIFQAKALGQSYDNNIWVYDDLESKLKKIGEDGKMLLETPDLRFLFPQAPSPTRIYDEDKYVYMYDSLKGVFVFDYFGALKNNILIEKWQNFKVAGKYIFGSKNGILYRYEISRFVFDEWVLPKEISSSNYFNFSATKLYTLTTNTKGLLNAIRVYTIK